MIVSTKNIELKTTNNKINVIVSSKKNIKDSLESKIILNSNFYSKSLSSISKVKSINLNSFTKSLNLKSYLFKPLGVFVPDPVSNNVTFTKEIPSAHSMFSFALDISKIKNSSGEIIDYTQIGIDVFLQNSIYEYLSDDQPLFYKDELSYKQKVHFVKNNNGDAYLPLWGFNGIGNSIASEGYRMYSNSTDLLYFKYTGEPYEINTISDIGRTYTNGWNTIGTTKTARIDAQEFFKPMVDEDQVQLVKDFDGNAYLPDWNFNGIGDLIPGDGYQVYFRNI